MAFLSKQQPTPQPIPAERKPAPAPAAEAKSKPKPRSKSPSPWPWGRFSRILTSLAIIFHLTAVFSAPWYLQLYTKAVPMVEPGGAPRDAYGREIPPEQVNPATYPFQTPRLPRLINGSLRHYCNLLFINHGYDFFSPDPGVSHLIRYEVYSDAGEKLADGQFPERRQQWPRLFYHRHMMLVEQLFEPGGDDSRARNSLYRIADRLVEAHGGDAARLRLLRHHLLTPQQVIDGQRIDAESTYEELDVIEHRPPPKSQEITAGGGP